MTRILFDKVVTLESSATDDSDEVAVEALRDLDVDVGILRRREEVEARGEEEALARERYFWTRGGRRDVILDMST